MVRRTMHIAKKTSVTARVQPIGSFACWGGCTAAGLIAAGPYGAAAGEASAVVPTGGTASETSRRGGRRLFLCPPFLTVASLTFMRHYSPAIGARGADGKAPAGQRKGLNYGT